MILRFAGSFSLLALFRYNDNTFLQHMDKYIEELNAKQQEAIKKLEGPVLVIAGAGSGKTKTLTYRIAYLIEDKHVNPINILAVTFTNKAANEMKERIYHVIGKSDLPFVGTFHSICVRLLRREGENIGIRRGFTIYDSSDSLEAVKDAMNLLHISIREYNPNKIRELISSCKNELMSPEDYEKFARMPIQQVASQVYPLYQSILKDGNALDFDDLIGRTVELFSYKEILEKYQNQFNYILVDEYQDTNHAQYMLIKMLAAKHRNLYCVGDPDQNIYTFRGATIDNILNFEHDYPDATVVMLEQNYRSTKNILKAAHFVISKNVRRKEKEMWTENIEGDRVKRYIATGEKDEAYFIVQKLKQKGTYSESAILYRTNAQSRALEEVFLEENIPYRLVGGVRFYDRKEIKDILSYLKLLNNLSDNVSLKRIINVPSRKIGKKSVDDVDALARMAGSSVMEYLLRNKETLGTNLKHFVILIEYLLSLLETNEVPLSRFLTILIEKINYEDMLKDEGEAGEARMENIKELNSVASRYDAQELRTALLEFLEDVSLLEEESEVEQEQPNQVTMMSVHSAKGLEFDTVFMVGMEEGLFPHGNSMYDAEDLEEERRLCYVGMTRAKRELYMINAESRVLYGLVQSNPLSRFVRDVPDYLLTYEEKFSGYNYFTTSSSSGMNAADSEEYHPGDYVFHPSFYKGVVIDTHGDSVTVQFESFGVKKLLLSFAKGMKKVSGD
jgi:DNA helicase-2/ATP-dependent DNA helicase PcrA